MTNDNTSLSLDIRQIDEEIESVKSKLDMLNAKKKDLSEKKLKLENDIKQYKSTHQYAVDKNGKKYRKASEKMLKYADAIDHAGIFGWENIQKHKDLEDSHRRLFQYAEQYGLPEDSFELVSKYINEQAEIMKQIQDINRETYKREREESYKLSYAYQIDQERKAAYEREQKEEEEMLAKGYVRGPGGSWCTPARLRQIWSEMGYSENGNDYDDSGFGTYP